MGGPRLVYVASIGRSGSTLLELLLGAHPAISTIGELHLWPHSSSDRPVPCGCGQAIDSCEFWREMRRRVPVGARAGPALERFREHRDHGRTLRPREWPGFLRRAGADADVTAYGQATYEIVTTFADLVAEERGTRPGWVVDASKDPYRLNWLLRSGLLDVTVLHVIRDPRGFVRSERKNFGDPPPTLRFTARKSASWVVHNHLIRLAARRLPRSRYALVRYEQLATAPGDVLGRIWELLGCAPAPEVIDGFRDHRFHAIGGNPMRHRQDGIRLDDAWRHELPAWARLVAGTLTGPTRLVLR